MYLTVGSTVEMQARVFDAQGQELFLCYPPVVWSSSDSTVATVSPPAIVAGLSAGKVYIRAQSGGVVDSAAVTVAATSIGVGTPARVATGVWVLP